MHKIVISPGVERHVRTIAREFGHKLGNPSQAELEFNYTTMLDVGHRLRLLHAIEETLALDLSKLRVLEIGSGVGLFVVVCHALDITCDGVEPAANSYGATALALRALLDANHIPQECVQDAVAENLPLDDEQYDLIVSFNVMEHTRSPAQMLSEAYRVLRPGGYIYFRMPNYTSFYEGHYRILWLPFFNKRLARVYLRLLGRPTDFLDELVLLRPRRVVRWAREAGFEILGLYPDQWQRKTAGFQSRLSGYVERSLNEASPNLGGSGIFALAYRPARLLRIDRLLMALHLHPMMALVARKTPHADMAAP